MDGGDVSLAIRRARRSGATSIDLSNRGLRVWPEGLSALRTIKAVDLSCNELSSLDPALGHLDGLEELNISNNRLEALPELGQEILPNLRSLVLDGNPMASRLLPGTLRELVRPPRMPGQTPVQVIRSLLFAASQSDGPNSRSKLFQAGLGTSQVEDVSTVEDVGPAWLRKETSADAAEPAWREQQKTMLKEMRSWRK